MDWLRQYWGRNYVGLIHRLDRNTSGVMIVAKRTKSAQRLTDTLQKGLILRTYLGWTVGILPSKTRWSHRLDKNTEQNTVKVVQFSGKEAVLLARPIRQGIWRGHPLTLTEFTLETGRSHQIRVQSAHEGFPLLGDSKYGKREISLLFPRVALHSHRLEFPHPMSGEILKFEDPLPHDLAL